MINSVYDLIKAIKERGVPEIEKYLDIQHNPTIGDMYEGLTNKLVSESIFHGLDLRVTTGKIKNGSGRISDQIDCMVVIGEGEAIPFTNKHIYDINKVVAVIEVKKNLFTKELSSAYDNLKSVTDITEPNRDMDATMLRNAFRSIAKVELPEPDEVKRLTFTQQMIYHALVMECYLPARIVFGYSGFVNEHSLRKNFIKYIKEQQGMSDTHGAKGYGAVSLPNLIICGDNTLIKANGLPYIVALNTGDWMIYASYGRKPLYVFLEVLWSKISTIFPIGNEPFGHDMKIEAVNPLLIAIPHEKGWEYIYYDLTKKELSVGPDTIDWTPVKLSDTEFVLMNKLCNGAIVKIGDDSFLSFLESVGESLESIITHLSNERLIYVDNLQIKLLTDQCACIITPEGFFAGENKDGRLMKWSFDKQKNSK